MSDEGFLSFTNNLNVLSRDPAEVKEFEKQFEEVRYDKSLTISDVQSKIYDLSIVSNNASYCDDLKMLMIGGRVGTHKLLDAQKVFVADRSTWLAHLAWIQIELIKKSIESVIPKG